MIFVPPVIRRAIAFDKNSVIPTGAEPLDFARDRLREAQWSNCIVVGQAPTVI
jgi:hypothetical protein